MGLKILRRKTLLEKLGFSSATLHRKIKAGEFPPPLRLGPNMRGWMENVADDYLNSLQTNTDVKPVAPGAKRGRKRKNDRAEFDAPKGDIR
jgi:prophage regulatory protein